MNYKPQVNQYTINGIKRSFTLPIFQLYDPTNGANGPDSVRSTSNVLYNNSKTFICVGVRILLTGVVGNLKIYAGDNENDITTLKLTLEFPAHSGWIDYAMDEISLGNDHITTDPSQSAQIAHIEIYGYET